MISVGPFSIDVVTVFLALVMARIAVRFLPAVGADARRVAGALVLDGFLVGACFARLVYVVRHAADYMAAPRAILAIGDGGFSAIAGVAAAVAYVLARTMRRRAGRREAIIAIAVGVFAWATMQGALLALRRAAPVLPPLEVVTLDGAPTRLDAFRGRPLVVNLWATWCPPCRREMPALAAAERAHPEVDFVLLNQGESSAEVRAFLTTMNLEFEHALLDPHSRAMAEFGARGLPATLFFDAEGRMVDSHLGEISRARLGDVLARRLPAQNASP